MSMPKPKGEREKPTNKGLLKPASEQDESQMPSPGDHVRMMIELLQPAGPDLARRWLAALMLVPREDREGVVESVEERIASTFADGKAMAEGDASPSCEIEVVHPPVQHDGYVEQVRTTYAKSHTQPDEKLADNESTRTERAG